MIHELKVRHNFETAHRLPQLGGKCTSLHGHSWHAELTVGADQVGADGIIADVSAIKKVWRGWIDEELDHGTMLAAVDPLIDPLKQAGCKVFRFGAHLGLWTGPGTLGGEVFARGLPYPSMELVAELLYNMAAELVTPLLPGGAAVVSVHVQEKHDNFCTFTPRTTP